MADDEQIIRQWRILRALAHTRAGLTIQDLIDMTLVKKRTIQRDLDDLLQAGFPLDSKNLARGKKSYFLNGNLVEVGNTFTFDEVLAIYLGQRMLGPLAGTGILPASHSALKRIREVLPPKVIQYLDAISQRLHVSNFGFSDYSAKVELIDELVIAIEDCKQTILSYQSLRATEPFTYGVQPLGLLWHKGSLYLIAVSNDHDGAVRTFKMDRIEDVKRSNVPFTRPAGFDLARQFAKSLGMFQGEGDLEVKVRFAPRVVRYIEEGRWHATQKLTKQRDGGVLLEMTLSSTEEVKRWLLGFGPHAVVLGPPELRQEIQAELRAALEHYPVTATNGAPVPKLHANVRANGPR